MTALNDTTSNGFHSKEAEYFRLDHHIDIKVAIVRQPARGLAFFFLIRRRDALICCGFKVIVKKAKATHHSIGILKF